MKLTRLNRFLGLILIVFVFAFSHSSCCKNQIHGTFYISSDALKYIPDTTITSFEMIDNNGLTESFYLDESSWYKTHLYMNQWGEENSCGDAFITQTFGAAYKSTINRYFYMITIRSSFESVDFELEWNQNDRFRYDFYSKTITSELKSNIQFIDSMVVGQISYKNIILFDQTNIQSQINPSTPKRIYLAAGFGLIKFETFTGLVFERKP